jgi:hypothetical protein
MKNKIIPFVLVIIGFTLGATALSTLAAWTVPSCTPPNCNVDAPINATTSAQTKLGPLTLNANLVAPIADIGLTVYGKLKVFDGNQAAGKVLTSDANGVGTWQSRVWTPYTLSAWNGGGGISNSKITTFNSTESICVLSRLSTGGCDTGADANMTIDSSTGNWQVNLLAHGDCDMPAEATYMCTNF